MADIPLAGVIGDPVAHSRSPALHGHWLRHHELRGHYIPLHVAAQDLAEVLRCLPRMGFIGANVTLPHKEAAFALAARATPRARRLGAANTLTFLPDGSFEVDNTDGEGFLASLRQSLPGWDARRGPAVILGAGGAVRAIAAALCDAGAPEIRVVNRTPERAEAIARDLGATVRPLAWAALPAPLEDAALLVNGTTLGMHDQPRLALDLDTLPSGAVVTDIVYTPLETDLLRSAARRGHPTVDGLGMLLHQAVPGFARWFGKRPEVDEAARRAALGA